MPELGRDFFRRAVRGKYFNRVTATSNVVRIAQDLTADFPNEAAVNEALRGYRRLCQAFDQIGKSTRGRARRIA
jgi:hypothetical protein